MVGAGPHSELVDVFRATAVLQHLAFVSPNAAELAAMAQAACEALHQRRPQHTAHGSRPPPPQEQRNERHLRASSQLEAAPLQQGAEAGGGPRGVVAPLVPYLAVLLQVGASESCGCC